MFNIIFKSSTSVTIELINNDVYNTSEYDVYLDPKNDYLINKINESDGYNDVDKINWVSLQNNVKIYILNKNNLS